jgi:hypothetical protein
MQNVAPQSAGFLSGRAIEQRRREARMAQQNPQFVYAATCVQEEGAECMPKLVRVGMNAHLIPQTPHQRL